MATGHGWGGASPPVSATPRWLAPPPELFRSSPSLSWKTEDQRAVFSDRNAVLKVGGTLLVFGDHRPAVLQNDDLVRALVDHRFNGQHQSRFELNAPSVCDVVQNDGLLMQTAANTVPGKFLNQ